MDFTRNLEQQTNCTPRPEQERRRSIGSFYDLLPSILDPIEKPSRDDILQRLNENKKGDRKAEWRIRTRYEGGCSNEFENLLKRGTVSSSSNFHHVRDSSCAGQMSVNNKSNSVLLGSNHLKYTVRDDSQIETADTIRELCRRKGELFGPEVIAAVGGCGMMTTRSEGSSTWRSPRLQVGSYQDDYDYESSTILWSRNTPLLSRVSSTSSTATAPQRNTVTSTGGTDHGWERVQRRWGMLQKGEVRNGSETKSGEDSRDRTCLSGLENRITKRTSINKTKLITQCELGCGDKIENFEFKHGNLKAHKKARSKMRPQRRRKLKGKANVGVKQKSASTRIRVEDKRHKGPKIDGINWSTLSEPIINSNDREIPILRTVVLPYPQSKHKQTII